MLRCARYLKTFIYKMAKSKNIDYTGFIGLSVTNNLTNRLILFS